MKTNRLKKFTFKTLTFTAYIACGAASIFLLASGYESIFNRSLPFIHTIDTANLTAIEQTYDINDSANNNEKRYGNYGRPTTLKLPERAARFDLVAPIKDEQNNWLARSNTLHLLLPEEPRRGNMGVALMYCRSSFRTISASTLPQEGSNLFVDTDRAWRYVYRITSTSVAPASNTYVPADDGNTAKLLITCFNSSDDTNIYIEANLLSVQGADL